ncbi:alpha/beta fold hydrolase [Streptosporangium sp. NPDC000396]|uniref:alpha/beta hydrolase family protein n=1 Tax=Streptosporangium sp. NPDC000396 TaxID=3366185 RepID=UPI0036963EA4
MNAELEFLETGEGARLALHHHEPGSGGPVVLILPAMGVPAAYYGPFVETLTERGFAVAVLDLRGQGKSTPRASRHGYLDLVGDVPVAVEAVRKRYPGRSLLLLGHSLGGQIGALHLAAHERHGVAGLVLVASGTAHHRVFGRGRGAGLYLFGAFASLVVRLVGHWPGHRLGFGGRQPAMLMREWSRLVRTGKFLPVGAGRDLEAALAEVDVPVLAFSVDADFYAPPGAVDGLVAKLSRIAVDRRHYSAEAAGRPDLGHFRWTRAAGPLAGQIRTWTEALGH